MPPKTRHRSQSVSTSGRVTRSQANSDTSRESSEATETEERRAAGAAKPDVKSEVSLAYGSPHHSKAPKRLASRLRQRNIEALIEDAVDESANVVVRDEDRDQSVAGSRLSDIEEANSEGGSTVHASPIRQAAIGQASFSFNVEAPVGRSAGLDENGRPVTADRLTPRNLRRINRESSASGSDYVEQLMEKMSSATDFEPAKSRLTNLWKVLLFGSLGLVWLMTMLGTNGITNAASGITHDLTVRVHRFLSPAVASPVGNCTDLTDLTNRFNTIAVQLNSIKDRYERDKNEVLANVGRLTGRIDSLSDAISTQKEKRSPGINAFAVSSGLLVDPHLTSPTKRIQEKYRLAPLLRWYLGAPTTKPQTPYAALQPWEDYGDCWCATAGDGHAQLSLILPHGVVPERLELEHIGKQQTPNPGSMPKDFELWAHIEDKEAREWAEMSINEQFGPPQSRPQTLPALDENWARVMVGKYNAKSAFTTQVFLPHTPSLMGRGSSRVFPQRYTLRINSVWGEGSDHVCIYRVKLFGAAPEYQTLDYHT